MATVQITLLGCGKMGGAMLQGWLKKGLSSGAVLVVDPATSQVQAAFPDLGPQQILATPDRLPSALQPAFVILAVKPQMMDQAVDGVKALNLSQAVVLSIAAGKTLTYFENRLGRDKAIVRAMPNTPAAIGRGITVGCANPHVTPDQKDTCHILLSAVGQVDWVEDEALMDAVTAVSGSGPAYVFHLVEALAAAGKNVGLSPELAGKLAAATVSGAGALLDQAGEDATQLRINVTSPKGTTEAALNVLMDDKEGLGVLLEKAVRAAYERSKELAD